MFWTYLRDSQYNVCPSIDSQRMSRLSMTQEGTHLKYLSRPSLLRIFLCGGARPGGPYESGLYPILDNFASSCRTWSDVSSIGSNILFPYLLNGDIGLDSNGNKISLLVFLRQLLCPRSGLGHNSSQKQLFFMTPYFYSIGCSALSMLKDLRMWRDLPDMFDTRGGRSAGSVGLHSNTRIERTTLPERRRVIFYPKTVH